MAEQNNGKKVLVIEDDYFLRSLITKKLREEQFEVFEAIDGEKGLETLKTEKPDIILLDLVLPGMDGFDVLQQIKKGESTKDIPVIVLSNLGAEEDVARGKELGARDYMIKANFTPSEIVAKIKHVLE